MNIFKGLSRNYLFIGIVAITVILQVRFVSNPSGWHLFIDFSWCYILFLLQVIIVQFLGKFAKTEPLSWKLWLISIAIGFVRLVAFTMADSKLKVK